MFTVLVKKFIKDYKNVKDPAVRTKYGVLSGTVGIGLNVVLFAVKYFAGLISGSVAITADAFNNLSDAGSSVIWDSDWPPQSLTRSIRSGMEELNTFPRWLCL